MASFAALSPDGTAVVRSSHRRGGAGSRRRPSAVVRASAKDFAFDQSSRSSLQIGVQKLANAVGVTLGPRVILKRSHMLSCVARGELLPGHVLPKFTSFAAASGANSSSSGTLIEPQSSVVDANESAVDSSRSGDNQGGADMGDEGNMVKVCDKLIGVFMVDKPTATDWRRLLAFSRKWDNIRPHFYARCLERADAETDPEMKQKLLRLRRKLKEIDDDVKRHNELLEAVTRASTDVHAIVRRRRKDFTKEFFDHLYNVAQSYYNDPVKQNDVAKLGNLCLAAVQAHDNTSESSEAMQAAALKLQDILNSPTVDAACRKIDDLAGKKELDSAMVLMLSKAWAAAKETDMTKDEAKDVLYHLYTTAVRDLQSLVPKEVRILKYILTIEDPEERLAVLNGTFTPGVDLEGEDVDHLYTTPEVLYGLVGTIVDAYHYSKEGTLMREARDLMNPRIIQKIEEIKRLLEDEFL